MNPADPPTAHQHWVFAADRGGTFTDVVGVCPAGELHTRKLLSQSPAYPDALVTAIRQILGVSAQDPFPTQRVGLIRVGTTVATNALLERKGEPAGLLITEGFHDLLEIGTQSRPAIFALNIVKPEPLYRSVETVAERLDAQGRVLRPLSESATKRALQKLYDSGLRSVAVVLMHAWINPSHEIRVGRWAREVGFEQISLSHQCMRALKILPRGQTSMVDAYLSPVLRRYVEQVSALTGGCRLEFMQSAGGLVAADQFRGKDAILSGPAGGVVAVARLAERRGNAPLIGFDMGGTSTDVCRYHGAHERVLEVNTAGISYQANMLHIETVAAGGGSLLGFDGQRMLVGPHSAGADPGPACYGRGGALTITDANLLLGRLRAEDFPKQFGPDHNSGPDRAVVREKFLRLQSRINRETGRQWSVEQVALGFLRIADQQMAKPIKTLSVSRGYDVRTHHLCCFGGAGGLHACSLARTLGIKRILVHPMAGIFSAWGILGADNLLRETRSVLMPLQAASFSQLNEIYREMAEPLARRLTENGGRNRLQIVRLMGIRATGSDGYIQVGGGSFQTALRDFTEQHQRRFGYLPDLARLEILNLEVEVRLAPPRQPEYRPSVVPGPPESSARHAVYLDDGWRRVPVLRRELLGPGDSVRGPALVAADHYTLFVDRGFDAFVDQQHVLVMEDARGQPEAPGLSESSGQPGLAETTVADPVLLEVFNHRFMSIADQMGAALINTAHSVNMKERLDFSCALFDRRGGLVANAPHIPVHLGAMTESVKALMADRGDRLRPGQTWITNHPGKGGSHLPDVTLINPVFAVDASPASGTGPDFFVATRGHHADIGGTHPGSMSPFCRMLGEEGILFDNVLVVDQGRFHHQELLTHLSSGPYPARNLRERVSDIQAQVAANRMGETLLRELVRDQGLSTVCRYMAFIQDNATRSIDSALEQLLAGEERREMSFHDCLDDGSPIRLRLCISRTGGTVPRYRTEFDFTGSAPQAGNSFNAPIAVVKAAVIYALRTLVTEDIPLNQGCMAGVGLSVPSGSLLNPGPDAAVVAGNVETSQRIVDVILGALGVAAASQGTMNNLILGWPESQYYETIGGGAGATATAKGASGVQVHMTNTRITDPEVLEQRYPGIRLREFSLRRGSGGAGTFCGGDGLIRQFHILQPVSVTLLTQRRNRGPFGLQGGQPGSLGNNWLIRNGRWQKLDACGNFNLLAGDILRLETPGGGGFGRA